ncbi:calmodulin-like protein 4 [Haliotis asinina]|uniref:calmodulin-like protein 4 n=1 Tax=Haliotis asinina TaxID=109174 RepID=UPI003531AE6F
MARFFDQQKIDEFKECFYFHARKGFIQQEGELNIIMRSLAYSPTRQEVHNYYVKCASKDPSTQGRIDFASFLDVMHEHSEVENCETEMLQGFRAQDDGKRGTVSATEMRHILMTMGEKLSRNEVDSLFQENGLNPRGEVQYQKFVDAMLTPSPDY